MPYFDPSVLVEAAAVEAEAGVVGLVERDLSSNTTKSSNMVLSPDNYVGDLFQRAWSETSLGAHKGEPNLAHLREQMPEIPINGGRGWAGRELGRIFLRLPYAFTPTITILVVAFEGNLGFAGQITNILKKLKLDSRTCRGWQGSLGALKPGCSGLPTMPSW